MSHDVPSIHMHDCVAYIICHRARAWRQFSVRREGTFTQIPIMLTQIYSGSIGSMLGVYYTPPENTVQKHLFSLVRVTYVFLH